MASHAPNLPRQSQHAQPTQLKHLLATYTTSHPLRSPSPLPPSSRVNPKVTQRLPPSATNPLFWSIPTWYSFIKFLLWKALHIAWSLLSHFLWGPARKSWGYRMTFIASVMRNVADHTRLADIVLVRRLVSLHFLVPLPADAVVTPITFVVPKHDGAQIARGFLRDLDRVENGLRELSGEWVVGTSVWKRLKAERRMKNRRSKLVLPTPVRSGTGDSNITEGMPPPGGRESPDVDTDSDTINVRKRRDGRERVIYYIHGGAYYVGNAATHRLVTIGVSKACNARVFAITYRLAPEHTFPLPLHDVFHGYLRLLAPPLSIPPENIIIAGDSAGGGLSLALCMYLRDEGYQLPAGLILMSPWVDLTMSCGSWEENMAWDVVPRPEADDHLNPVACYLGPKGISTYLTHPYASPLFGDLSGLPPMLIQSGDSEVLRDEITLLAHKATLAGVNVTHELYEDMVHVFQMFTFLPGAKAAISSVGRWVRQTLPKIEEEQRKRTTGVVPEGVDGEVSDGARLVDADGHVVSGPQETVATRDEAIAVADQRELRRRTPPPSSLRLSLAPTSPDRPSIDVDSLPSPASRSGSPTPTASPASRHDDLFSTNHPHVAHAPPLRRALTALATSTPATPSHSPPRPGMRRRRKTQGAASLHVSPSAPPSALGPSNPVSPTPSIRRRLRSPTLSSTGPSTRARSQSHSDIFELVEGYFEGGAANETTVFAPGGEIRSVGVLGEEEEP